MFILINLPYVLDALEPVISARTLEFHHCKHLQAYVDNLNKLLPGSGLEGLSLEDIVKQSSGALFNNAGQVLNHNMYFSQFKAPSVIQNEANVILSEAKDLSKGRLFSQIEKQWGTLDSFKADFESKGVTLFGSGWVWLSAQTDGTLIITQEPDAGNPVTKGLKPLLTFDVWEHAYYLDYQNRRSSYLTALWQILDWSVIEARYYQTL